MPGRQKATASTRAARLAPYDGPPNSFQRDAYLAALEVPHFDLGGGRVLKGRILSADEWFAYEDRLFLASKNQLTNAGLRALMVEMTDLTFPAVEEERRNLFGRRRRVLVKPSEYLTRMPWGAQQEQFQSFTLAQAEAQRGPTTRRAKTNSTAQTRKPGNGTP